MMPSLPPPPSEPPTMDFSAINLQASPPMGLPPPPPDSDDDAAETTPNQSMESEPPVLPSRASKWKYDPKVSMSVGSMDGFSEEEEGDEEEYGDVDREKFTSKLPANNDAMSAITELGERVIPSNSPVDPLISEAKTDKGKPTNTRIMSASERLSSTEKCTFKGCMQFAADNGFCNRHYWKAWVVADPVHDQKHFKVAYEILTTERTHCDGLYKIYHIYCKRLQMAHKLNHPIIQINEIDVIFQNIEALWRLSDDLVKDLEDIYHASFLTRQVGKTLMHHANTFRIYRTYLENYNSAAALLASLRKSNQALNTFIEIQDSCEGTKLESLLILPVQRLPRYLLLLKELEKQAPPDTEGIECITEAHQRISNIATAINQSLHIKDNTIKLKELQDRFEKDSRYIELVSDVRSLIKMGDHKKIFNGRGLLKGKYKTYTFFSLQ